LHSKVKVGGRTGQLGDSVTIERAKNKLSVTAVQPFSKRYVKYLTKKYLKKHNLRDWLRVIAGNKNAYTLKYFQVQGDDEEEAGDA
jgi:large subunit ribosomal protein L22e